ncbi:MAG: hypothetical protein ACYCVB_06975 [Bacilli bacterium]
MKTTMRADHLKFLKERVLNIQDITRSTKLTQILDSYAERVGDEVFVIQNDRKKDARNDFLSFDSNIQETKKAM